MSIAPFIRLMRPAQWVKNILVVVAAISSHRIADPGVGWVLLRLFLAMSLLASAVYVFNDVLDRHHDRQHPAKKRRPFASGELSVAHAAWLVPLLLVAVAWLAWPMPALVGWLLAAYVLINLLYGFALKRMPWLDVVVLAALYAGRVLIGAFAINVVPSEWLLAFAMFIFVSLAALKRLIELRETDAVLPGRGYRREDLPVVLAFGAASAVAAVLVMALYVNSEAVRLLYARPAWLWGICVLLWYWLARVWTLANRGYIHHDPVMFAAVDPASWFVAAAIIGCAFLAV